MECTFSRTISVIQGDENSDFNLDNSYYIMIGTGGQQGAYELRILHPLFYSRN